MKKTAESFLREHNMYYGQMPFEDLVKMYLEEMEAGLRGEPSSLLMLPSFIRSDEEPARGESVLVLDAGGTNLRAGLIHFDETGKPVVEVLKKRWMPGTGGVEVDADEMYREMARFALDCVGECRRACISFSYACESRPDGDGIILNLCKELRVRNAEGTAVCASLEKALKELGAPGRRSWRVVNDAVGSMLGGMAEADRSRYADYIGFILGTGTNACCTVPSEQITKNPQAAAMGGEMIVNMESGCFTRMLRGTVDLALDSESAIPGDHQAEKMISGSYYRQVLGRTLELAAREGALSSGVSERLKVLRITSALVDAFCLEPHGDNPIARALGSREDRDFGAAVNDALLERAARVAAACLCAVIEKRGLPRGSRVGVCADGTMLRLNPVLRPKMEAYLDGYALEKLGVKAEFLFAEDATLLGSAWAGLLA